MEGKKTKLKAGAFVHPHTPKQCAIAIMMLIVIIASIVPFINLVNKPILVFGMPLFYS